MHKMTARLLGVLFTIVVAVVACGGDDDGTNAISPADSDGTVESPVADEADDATAGDEAADDGMADDSSCAADGDDCMVMLDGEDDGGHDHDDGLEVPETMAIPAVGIDVTADPSSGQNLQVTLANFAITPEKASTDPADGQGHLHLYVDGERVLRFYNEWLHLSLEPGDHTIDVEVSANNHSAYTIGGEPIRASASITVPESEAADSHHDTHDVDAAGAPEVGIDVTADPKSGWNVQATVEGFTITPENASTDHIEGQGHLHLYVDGVRVTRLYGPWWHLGELTEGDHEISVELATNNHHAYAVNGVPVAGSATVSVSADRATEAADHDDDDDHDGDDGHDDGDMEQMDEADVSIEIDFTGGDVTVDDDRISIDRDSTVSLQITSDVAEHVHLHGYDIFIDVAAGETVLVTFLADVPGVFEVEFEDSFTFVTELQVS